LTSPVSTVLLVEDDANDVFFLRRAFQKAGLPYPLQDVSDGEKATAYLSGEPPYADRQQFPLPRLVMLDLKLPLKSGFEVLEWVRSQPCLKSLPVVILTSSNVPEDIAKAQMLKADQYLVKPTSPTELVEIVKALAQTWLAPEPAK